MSAQKRTLSEEIAHLHPTAQRMVLTEAPHGWLVGTVPPEITRWLGQERTYFIDLGIDDWPNAATVGDAYQLAIAAAGISIPLTQFKIGSPRTHELTVERRDGSETLKLPSNWFTYVQLADFHRAGDAIVWFGQNVRSDRRAPDVENFIDDLYGWRRIDY